jgi:chorismate mutase
VLTNLRLKLDALDAELLTLLAARRNAVMEIAAYKQRHGLPAYDPERQRVHLAAMQIRGAEFGLAREYVSAIFQTLFAQALQDHARVCPKNEDAP